MVYIYIYVYILVVSDPYGSWLLSHNLILTSLQTSFQQIQEMDGLCIPGL